MFKRLRQTYRVGKMLIGLVDELRRAKKEPLEDAVKDIARLVRDMIQHHQKRGGRES